MVVKVCFCPKCLDSNFKVNSGRDYSQIWLGTDARYYCLSCGFKSIFFPDVPLEEYEQMIEEEKKKQGKK